MEFLKEKAKPNISICHVCLVKSPDMTKKGLGLSFLYLLFKQTCSSGLLFHHPLGFLSLGKTSPAPSTSISSHLHSRHWTMVAALSWTFPVFSHSPWGRSPRTPAVDAPVLGRGSTRCQIFESQPHVVGQCMVQTPLHLHPYSHCWLSKGSKQLT